MREKRLTQPELVGLKQGKKDDRAVEPALLLVQLVRYQSSRYPWSA
jgi:hypothetical protein